jgi:hypothetical protein
MPSIASRTVPNLPESKWTPPVREQLKPPLAPPDPRMSPVLRSPLPNLVVTQPDSLRQYYAGGQIPQYRFPPLKPIA